MVHFDYKKILIQQFLQSVAAVNPAKLIADNVKIQEGKLHILDKVFNLKGGNIYLVGFGKAVLGMASQCEKILGNRLKRGIICIPENSLNTFKNNDEFSLKTNSVIDVYEGAKNNLPDEKAEKGANAIIHLVKSLNSVKDDLIVLISGGGSALFPKPKPGITLAEKMKTIVLLASSGADICELNEVRKKLSLVKGGGLACLSYPVNTICLILSDIINDPLDLIASGPTVPNLSNRTTAYDILEKYGLQNKVPHSVSSAVRENSSGFDIPVIDKTYLHVHNFIIGNNLKALHSAKQYAEGLGIKTIIISRSVSGSVETVSNFYINLVFEILNDLEYQNNNLITPDNFISNCFPVEDNFVNEIHQVLGSSKPKNICLLAGGEITVKVEGKGKGGRSQQLALVMSIKIHELKTKYPNLFEKFDVVFLAAGTDGIDGPTDAAGAVAHADVINSAKKMNLNVNDYLVNNDSYNFFDKIDDSSYLIKIGHTGTNVMDIHSLVVYQK